MRTGIEYTTLLLFFVLLVSCTNNKQPSLAEADRQEADTNHFKNVDKVEVYGDSLRIEYEFRGDTIVEHRIDLKGIHDDGFDNTFTAVRTTKNRESSRLECSEAFNLWFGEVSFQFCKEEARSYYDSLARYGNQRDSQNAREVLKNLEGVFTPRDQGIVEINFFLPLMLIQHLRFKAMDSISSKEVARIAIESYETEFSGGKNYYVIDGGGDTMYMFHQNEYMR